jgi:shikimate kinase
MPGAGKSTVGIILAKLTSRDFVDTDVLIQTSQKRTLQNIVDTDGYEVLRSLEAETLCGISVRNCVIATGGSAVYSDEAMMHLMSDGVIIFLDVGLPALEARIHNYRTRGLAKRADQSFADLFHERCALYTKYAEITITCAGLTHEEVCIKIIDRVQELQGEWVML